MAEINISDLIKIIKEHPDYSTKIENGVPIEKSLYIKFHDEPIKNLTSEVVSLKNGNELVLDIGEKRIIYGIEII